MEQVHFRHQITSRSSLHLQVPTSRRTSVSAATTIAAAILFVLQWNIVAVEAQDDYSTLEPRIRAHIEYLASPELRGRRGGSGMAAARQYIIKELEKAGARPFFNGDWIQTVPGQTTLAGDQLPDGENIGGFVPGTDPELRKEWIIVNAHYDHLGVIGGRVYPGADDNASGVALLLEVARAVAARPLKRSVAFVAFDFEEHLLWGSRWFIGNTPIDLDRIRFCLTTDMIGRSLGGLGLPTVFVLGAEHSSLLRDTLAEVDIPAGLEMAQLGTDMIGTRSDYGPFRDQRIPFLFFSTGEHPDYHSPADTADRIDYPKATRIVQLAIRVVTSIGNSEQTLEWEDPVYQKLEEAQAVHRITELLTEADNAGTIQLSSTQRFFISQVRSKTGYMVRKQRVSDEERKWVARAAMVLLLSVF